MSPRPWGSLALSEDDTFAVRVGPRDLWLTRHDGDIWLSHAPVAGDDADDRATAEPPDEAHWKRWAPPGDRNAEVRLRPAFPDRAVVLQPEQSFHLTRNARARIYVRVPLFIRVELGGPDPDLLEEIPSVTLSDTWWGTFVEGELAYWLPTTARRSWSPGALAPHLAVCPLEMHNRAAGELHVEKLSLRVMHLTLYGDDRGFWADETRVVYEGEEEAGVLEMTGRPPPEARDAERVEAPRVPLKSGLRVRTFTRFLNMGPMAPFR